MNRNLCTHPTLNRTTEGYAPAAGEREGGNILPRQGRGFERVRRVCPLEHLGKWGQGTRDNMGSGYTRLISRRGAACLYTRTMYTLVRRVCPLEHLIQSRCSVEHVGLMYALQGYLAHTPLGSP